MPSSTEAHARRSLIDPALRKAGWDVDDPDQVGIEIPVDGFDPAAWKALEAKLKRLGEAGVPYKAKLPAGVSDYVLYRPNGEVVAVVEAKRSSIDPRLAQAQTEFYVAEIEKRQSFPALCLYDQRPRPLLLGRGTGQQAAGGRLFLPCRPGEPALHPHTKGH